MNKKIYTILVLLFNVIFRRKHYTLNFISESDNGVKLWFYNFKNWGFDKNNLTMVSGADDLCEHYSNDGKTATVDVVASRYKIDNLINYDHYVMEKAPKEFNWPSRIIYGRYYKEDISGYKKSEGNYKLKTFWICPVTLFVLGRYPKHLYIKTH